MRFSVSMLLAAIIEAASAQSFAYPSLATKGISSTSFAPKGWTVLDSAYGDLNGDGVKDMALIFQHKDSVTIIKPQGYPDTVVITQPRILGLFFFNKASRQYELAEQSNTFVLNHDDPIMDEPYRSISISNRILEMDFFIWYSMGTYEMSVNKYKFRYQNGQFALIGADIDNDNRATGDTELRSFNFLTRKLRITKGNRITNAKAKSTLSTFELKELKTIRTFPQPFTWDDFNL